MQVAGMLRGTGAMRGFHVLVIGTLILAYIGENAHAYNIVQSGRRFRSTMLQQDALPLQLLPNIPGYIPVYIRHGDQPLDEINPELAEAFHEKQSLESIPSERLDNSADDLTENSAYHGSHDERENDDNGRLIGGTRRKETIFLIGVRQSHDDRTKSDADVAPKIALPFEILERETIEANSAINQDREKSDKTWIEDLGRRSNKGNPIGLSKEAAIKVSGVPVDVKDLERLAAEVEREETRPNDLYDTSIANEHHVPSSRRSIKKITISENTNDSKDDERIIGDAETFEDGRVRPINGPKEFRSRRGRARERRLRPARDPKESRPDEELADFMVQEE